MPRIELIPPRHNPNDASPTIDVCTECSSLFDEGKQAPAELGNMLLSKVGSTDVEHPNYDDDRYTCAICHCSLVSEDD